MQIIIEISEDDYKEVKEETYSGIQKEKTYSGIQIENRAFSAIANGTPLPKGHGRLIDADDLIRELSVVSSRPIKSQLYILRGAPTIIEADKESEDKE